MSNVKDAVLTGSIVLAMAIFVFGSGAVALPGTGSTNYICSVPVVSDYFDNCNSGVAERYDVSTSIRVEATDVNAVLDEGSFQYETEKTCTICLSMIGFSENLAFGGANDVTLDFQMVNSEGTLVADGSKYIGELGVLQGEEVSFGSDNRPSGMYTVKYELTYTPDFGVTEGVPQVKTLEKSIRVPKRIE
jgi:hypothetical protein